MVVQGSEQGLREPSLQTVRERALDALGQWHAQAPWGRKDPATLAIDDVLAVGPTQVVLESVFERRGVRYALRRAPDKPAVPAVGPDPWSVTLEHPSSPVLRRELTLQLPGTLHMECSVCGTSGEMHCLRCGGSGYSSEGGGTESCFHCRARGLVVCDTCDGSGGVLGEPTVWSLLDRHREVRTVEDEALPMDVFFALHGARTQRSDATDGGGSSDGSVVIHEQTGERVHALQRSQGYRDDALHGAEARLHQVVGKLAAAPGVPSTDRIHRQRLEVRQVPVYQVCLRNGESVFIYGDPLQLSPPETLLTPLGKLARTFGWSR